MGVGALTTIVALVVYIIVIILVFGTATIMTFREKEYGAAIACGIVFVLALASTVVALIEVLAR